MSDERKERYAALHGGVWIANPDAGRAGAPKTILVQTGDVVELYPSDAERINRSIGLLLSPYHNGHLVPVKNERGEETDEVKNVPRYVKDPFPRLVQPSKFQKMRDTFDALKKPKAREIPELETEVA